MTDRIERKLDLILSLLRQLSGRQNDMSITLQALIAQVAATTSVEQSAITLIQGIAAQLADASADPAAVAALAASLKTSTDALAAAVAANTTPAP